MPSKNAFVLIHVLVGFAAIRAEGGLNLTLSPTANPSVIAYEFSGSTERTDDVNRNVLNFLSDSGPSSDFVDSAFNGGVTVGVSGVLTNTATEQASSFSTLVLINSIDDSGDDWRIILSGSASGTIGDLYTIAGSGTFTLGEQTFANFLSGAIATSNTGSGTLSFGPATLSVVPEPASYALLLCGATLFIVRRRRRHLVRLAAVA